MSFTCWFPTHRDGHTHATAAGMAAQDGVLSGVTARLGCKQIRTLGSLSLFLSRAGGMPRTPGIRATSSPANSILIVEFVQLMVVSGFVLAFRCAEGAAFPDCYSQNMAVAWLGDNDRLKTDTICHQLLRKHNPVRKGAYINAPAAKAHARLLLVQLQTPGSPQAPHASHSPILCCGWLSPVPGCAYISLHAAACITS